MDLLILPLKTIYQEIDSKGIEGNWWKLILDLNFNHPDDANKFKSAVDIADQYKYLAPYRIYSLIDEFIL